MYMHNAYLHYNMCESSVMLAVVVVITLHHSFKPLFSVEVYML